MPLNWNNHYWEVSNGLDWESRSPPTSPSSTAVSPTMTRRLHQSAGRSEGMESQTHFEPTARAGNAKARTGIETQIIISVPIRIPVVVVEGTIEHGMIGSHLIPPSGVRTLKNIVSGHGTAGEEHETGGTYLERCTSPLN